MFSSIDYQQCIHIINYGIPFIVTLLISIISLGIWLWWEEWKMKKEEAQIEKSLQVPEPLDVEEIPRKYLYFQKLALQIQNNNCINSFNNDIIQEIFQWMEEHSHKNTNDVYDVLFVLNSEGDDSYISEIDKYQANLWIETALYIWSINPEWVMPSFKKESIPRNRSWTIS